MGVFCLERSTPWRVKFRAYRFETSSKPVERIHSSENVATQKGTHTQHEREMEMDDAVAIYSSDPDEVLDSPAPPPPTVRVHRVAKWTVKKAGKCPAPTDDRYCNWTIEQLHRECAARGKTITLALEARMPLLRHSRRRRGEKQEE